MSDNSFGEKMMSENTTSENKEAMQNKNGSLGVKLALRNFKKYIIIGVIIPLLMTIPSMIVQGEWFKNDKAGTDPYVKCEVYESVPESWLDVCEEKDGKYVIGTLVDWPLHDSMEAVTDYGFIIIVVCLYIYLIRDVYLTFWGKRAALELAVPCSRTVIFLAKFIPAMICEIWTFFLIALSDCFLEGGFKLKDGAIVMQSVRSYESAGWGYMTGVDFIPWDSVCLHTMAFLVIYLGIVFLISLCSNLNRKMKDPAILSIAGLVTLLIAALSFVTEVAAFDNNMLILMFVVPVILLILCIISIRRHNLMKA